MKLLTMQLETQLRRNARQRMVAVEQGTREPDPFPVVRFFNPLGPASWLVTEMDEEGIMFGLADLGFGCPELGSFALFELEAIRLPLGLGIERDIAFEAGFPLSVYSHAARMCEAIVTAHSKLAEADCDLRSRHREC